MRMTQTKSFEFGKFEFVSSFEIRISDLAMGKNSKQFG